MRKDLLWLVVGVVMLASGIIKASSTSVKEESLVQNPSAEKITDGESLGILNNR